jgi:hypothetical protein
MAWTDPIAQENRLTRMSAIKGSAPNHKRGSQKRLSGPDWPRLSSPLLSAACESNSYTVTLNVDFSIHVACVGPAQSRHTMSCECSRD